LQEVADLPKLAKSDKAAAEHATDFDPPIYNATEFKLRCELCEEHANNAVPR